VMRHKKRQTRRRLLRARRIPRIGAGGRGYAR
jgi:hypothetical protein